MLYGKSQWCQNRDADGHSIPQSIDQRVITSKKQVSASWLSESDQDGDFPTNGDRFAAQEITKRQDTHGFTPKGVICQVLAVLGHSKSSKQLKEIADKVGRERIMVVHGTADNMIGGPLTEILMEGLGGEERGVTRKTFEGRGHYLPIEERVAFKESVEAIVEKAEAMR